MADHMVQNTEHTLDSFRLSMLSFYSSYNIHLAEAVGLGTVIKDLPGKPTRFHVYVEGFASHAQDVSDRFKSAHVPILLAKWNDKKVRLEWDVKELYKHFIGYHLERSVDGSRFVKLSQLPFLDPAVGIDGDKDGSTLGMEDSLSQNYLEYHYRLRSVDYFGSVSEAFTEVRGYGFESVKSSPQITYADQEENNHAHLKWEVDNQDLSRIVGFNLLRADNIDGPYASIDTLESHLREVHSPMTFETNYYRIEIIPKDGEPVSSFPVFVMGMDTIPPLTPVVIGASIDSLGRISISWHANQEQDLWGYRIFRSNFATDEYSLMNSTMSRDTHFIDSVSLIMGMKNVYYVLQAADKRNNRSPFTDPIVLERPDIMPPGSPAIVSLEQGHDTIYVKFSRSGSDDVILHQLFRRTIGGEMAWKLIAAFDTLNQDSMYADAGLVYGQKYAYSMRARDKANLQSPMAAMRVHDLIEPKVSFQPNIVVESTYDPDQKTIGLQWTADRFDDISSVLVYRGWEKDKLGKYKFVDALNEPFVDKVEGREKVAYRLKISYKNNTSSFFSNVVEVNIPE